ncbi:MAG TPA: hypothetical protein VM345_07860 [Acidimicrobiales bacterium]|jgi:hypothetical protein|nr:hypothetical protein [Acidimicrobiales bacterium]
MGSTQRVDARSGTFARVVAGIGGVALVVFGVWAMIAPESFFEELAQFEPYNQHFIQDIGAFQIGLGAVLLLALMRPSGGALGVALVGVGIGAAAHVASHAVGTDLGGTPAVDIPFFSILAGAFLAAGFLSWRR